MVVLNHFLLSFVATTMVASMFFWVAYIRGRRYDLVDVAWSLMIVAAVVSSYCFARAKTIIGVLVVALVLAWGLRLSLHILTRWAQASAEDPRYAELRQSWPRQRMALQVYTRIYLVQALLAAVVALPAVVYLVNQSSLTPLVAVGATLWAIGFTFEVVADRQLRVFIAQPENKGKLMRSGLWRYSRHPNYFGEITLWWGMAIIALSVPYGWVGLIGVTTLTLVMCFVSGVPPAERRASKKPGWAEYKRATSVLIPWPPR